ncbi:MAG: ABC transporter substrate-binding protein [Ginsengibacter sp.]
MILPVNNSDKKYKRIISVVPSLTELLFDLGLNEEVIGITKFCIHPQKWFKEKARIGGTKNLQIEKIQALQPDLIIANKEENDKGQIERLAENCDVYLSDVNTLADALKMIVRIGEMTDRLQQAMELRFKIKKGFDALSRNQTTPKIRSAYFIWKNPWMVAANNTFINEMMRYAGLENIFEEMSRYPAITMEEIECLKPDLILLSTEPYPFKEKDKDEFSKLFPQIKIAIADGEMFSWYGSRLLKSVDYFHSFRKNIS